MKQRSNAPFGNLKRKRDSKVDEPITVNGQDDAAKAQWFPLTAFLDKPSGKAERPELAFDHDEIMRDAIRKYKEVRETAPTV